MAGNDYRQFAHILDYAQQRNARSLAEPNFLADVGERDFLRRGDQNAAIDAGFAQEVHNRDVLVGGTRRSWNKTRETRVLSITR